MISLKISSAIGWKIRLKKRPNLDFCLEMFRHIYQLLAKGGSS